MISSKENANKALVDVSSEHFFYVCDGTVLKNIEELTAYLSGAKKEVFQYHVTPDRNDFSNWINDIIGDKKLAKDMYKAKSLKAALTMLKARVKWLRAHAK